MVAQRASFCIIHTAAGDGEGSANLWTNFVSKWKLHLSLSRNLPCKCCQPAATSPTSAISVPGILPGHQVPRISQYYFTNGIFRAMVCWICFGGYRKDWRTLTTLSFSRLCAAIAALQVCANAYSGMTMVAQTFPHTGELLPTLLHCPKGIFFKLHLPHIAT